MGLIRKSLMVGSLGLVRGSSKKQRVAKAQLRQLQQQTRIMASEQQHARAAEQQQLRATAVVNYADPAVRAALQGSHEQRMTELARIRAEANAPQAIALPQMPAGWYSDQTGVMRWWDGHQWTPATR